MRVRVLYFAGVREAVGCGEESLDLPGDVLTIADFARHIGAAHGLEARMPTIRIARNERFADPAERIEDGDTLALIPPVSGG